MPRKKVVPTSEAAEAARLLGTQIRLARHRRGMTAARLAELTDVSPRTMTLIERGDPSVTLGHALNAASHVGVALFDQTDPKTLGRVRGDLEQSLTLIPSSVRARRRGDLGADF